MSRTPIQIVGAGLGGLALGRGLLKRGIPAILFERAKDSQRHNYGITLHASTYKPLLEILEIDEQSFIRRVAVDASIGGNGAVKRSCLTGAGSIKPGSFRANRSRLEALLREGLHIEWDADIEVLNTSSNAVALSRSGQKLDKGLIVGADGVHSAIRKALLPHVKPNTLPFVTFNGKRRMSRENFDSLYARKMDGSTLMEMRHNDVLLQISINDCTEETVSISWVYSRATRGSGDVLFKPNRPLAGATDIPDEFYEEIAQHIDLAQPFRDVLDAEKIKKDRVLSWLMRTVGMDSSELQNMATKGVLLLGDAAHAQPILGGEGANMAITDGLSLAKYIANMDGSDFGSWYALAEPLWKDGIEQSRRAILSMHATLKPAL